MVGPAITEGFKGKGVAVLFPGSKGAIQCALNSVRRHRRRAQPTRSFPPPQLPLLTQTTNDLICGPWAQQVSRQPPSPLPVGVVVAAVAFVVAAVVATVVEVVVG